MAAPQSMEQSLLHNMIHERDAQISSLLHQLHDISDGISYLQQELHYKSQSRKQQREDHSAAIKRLKEEHTEQRGQLAQYESKIKGGGGLRVHEYAALMKAANKDVESSYVIRLQAQLCRAMHSLGVMESQLALVKENCSSLIKCMKEDLSHMVDDRTRREIELMNTLAMVDAEKRSWQAEMEKKLHEQEDLLDSVRDEYEELGLEYDEEEVRRALEVQMMQEQVDRVRNEKNLAEKDLLAAVVQREEQIQKLKNEVNGFDVTLNELKGDTSEKNDYDEKCDINLLGTSENDAAPSAGTAVKNDCDEKITAVGSGDQALSQYDEKIDENAVNLISKLQNTTIEGTSHVNEDGSPGDKITCVESEACTQENEAPDVMLKTNSDVASSEDIVNEDIVHDFPESSLKDCEVTNEPHKMDSKDGPNPKISETNQCNSQDDITETIADNTSGPSPHDEVLVESVESNSLVEEEAPPS